MLGLGADAGGKWVMALSKMGLAAIAVKEGLAVLNEAAKGVVEGSKLLGDAYVLSADKAGKMATSQSQIVAALHAVDVGLIKGGGSVADLNMRFETLVSHTNRAAKELQDFATGAGVKVPESFFKLQQSAAGLDRTLALAFQRGKATFLDYASTNETRLKQIEAEYKRHGERVPEFVQKAIEALKRECVELALQAKQIEAQTRAWDNLLASKAAQ